MPTSDRPALASRFARRLRRRGLFALLPLAPLLGLLADRQAHAGWPPPKDATAEDMKNPDNWPNDPDYGFAVGTTSSTRKSGQWELYSFIPDRSPGAQPLRAGETSAGMSVDLAWRHTIGDDRVRIAVLDCGVKWDETELVEKAWLNPGELASHKPHKANGDPCGGQGQLAGFDCNGDGILTVSDYADEPSLSPEATDGHPRGDKNNNGLLDAGDLILLYSDGKDDDGNGYVDDISGWDFLKDDNDPYEDTRFYHQSREARMSIGATNNGAGAAGSCPLCRYIPVRVGDSFIVNAQDYAQGVMYATDIGASMIQEALGSMNQTSFSQAAMDYAWRHGVVIVASMADENSRHHNMPAVANHTLPVHAICRRGAQDSTLATSFLQFNTCSNYGGHGLLSVPGEPCASEATGWFAGGMGLIYSAALQSNLSPALSASEARQLALMTADDIDVPESREPKSPYFYSQKGFDQRFGYGRANVNAAVEWVLDRKIPPSVEILSPQWYTVLSADRTDEPVPIEGRISAPRAASFDYVVEWAPGVQPLDEQFVPIPQASADNVPGTTVIGESAPLALFDIRGLDIDNPPDPDDTFYSANRHSITVRVRVTAHYDDPVGDVPGEMRRTYYVTRDDSLMKGFPIRMTTRSGGIASGESSPKLVDIDGDGVKDIISADADGELHVWKITAGGPVELPGFPVYTSRIDGLNPDAVANDKTLPDNTSAPGYSAPDSVDPDIARESIVAAPAVADIDGDGRNEIAFITWEGTLNVVRSDGSVMPGWPVRLPRIPSCSLDPTVTADGPCMDVEHRVTRGAFGAPAIADMNQDGKLDIVIGSFDGYVHVYQPNGTELKGWPVLVHYPGTLTQGLEYSRVFTTPTLDDFNGDGIPDVLVGSNERLGQGENAGAMYVIDGRGNAAGDPPYLPGWPVTTTSLSLFPTISEGVSSSGAAGDVDGDGVPEAVMHGTGSAPLILPRNPGPQQSLGALPANALPDRGLDSNGKHQHGLEPTTIFGDLSKAKTPDTMFPLFAQPSLGDLDQDGTLDVVASGGSLSMAQSMFAGAGSNGVTAQHMLAMWNGRTGKMMPGSPVLLEDYTFFNNQAIADLNGDDYPEVITGTAGYFVRAVDACGREAAGFPKFTGQWIIGTTAVGDIDGDHKLELVVPTRSGYLYAWKTEASTDGVIVWDSFHHDARNTGTLSTKLDQGVYFKAAHPLDCYAPTDTGQSLAPGELAGAGCSCGTTGSHSRPWSTMVACGLVGLAVLRLRRRPARERAGTSR